MISKRNNRSKPLSTGEAPQQQYVFGTEKLTRYQFPTHITDLVVDRAQAACSEVFVVVIRPQHASPLHKHGDMEQIFYVLAGKGTLTIGKAKQPFPIKTGDVVRVPVNTLHSVRADGDTDLKYLSVDCFSPNRPNNEPTWDDHIRNVCKEQGWDFSKAVIPNGGGSSAK
jgi:quercetin dioxygenase-like cupin family protein